MLLGGSTACDCKYCSIALCHCCYIPSLVIVPTCRLPHRRDGGRYRVQSPLLRMIAVCTIASPAFEIRISINRFLVCLLVIFSARVRPTWILARSLFEWSLLELLMIAIVQVVPHFVIWRTSRPYSFRNKSEEIPCEREVYLFLRSNVQSIVYHDIMNIILSNRNERLMKQINNS